MTRSKYSESYLTFLELVPDFKKYRFYGIDFVCEFIKFLKQDESTFFLISFSWQNHSIFLLCS